MKSTRKMTNRTFAIQTAVPAMPVNPRNAAMIATMKNRTAQLSICTSLSAIWLLVIHLVASVSVCTALGRSPLELVLHLTIGALQVLPGLLETGPDVLPGFLAGGLQLIELLPGDLALRAELGQGFVRL